MKDISISYIKKLINLKNIPSNLKNENSHLYSQIYNTYFSLILVLIILLLYFICYLSMGNLLLSTIIASVFLPGLVSFIFFINNPEKRKKIASNITIFILFITTYAITLFTGGIESSTVIWIFMYPAIMVFMTDIKNATIWFVMSVFSITSLYFIKDFKMVELLIGSSPRLERIMDMIFMTVALFIIIYAVDKSYKKILKKLENTQSKLRILATTDPLTELYNRRFFQERAVAEIKRSIRHNKSLTLLMLDLDHFKNINDNFGHKTGDHILKEVSSIFQKALREIDLTGRYGGEEFIMLFPESDKATSVIAAERIRKQIENTDFKYNRESIKLTISIGITEIVEGKKDSLDTLIYRADKALYLSKENGRNRITVWSEFTQEM